MALTPAEVQIRSELVKLLNATGSSAHLKDWIRFATGDDLETYTSSTNAKPKMLHDIIENMLLEEQNGRAGILEMFLLEVYRDRPMRPALRRKIAEFRPRIAELAGLDNARIQIIDASRESKQVSANVGGDLQETLRQQRITDPNNPMLDGVRWARQLYENLTRVCRIEIGGQAAGTGFLVGPNAVLTNWHVVEGAAPADIRCRFDYAVDVTGRTNEGKPLALDQGGILCGSPYWANERSGTRTPDGPPEDCLDFALLHIRTDGLDQGTPRGFVRLPDNPPMPSNDSPLIILQHPAGAPVQVAIDTRAVVGWELRDAANVPFWTGPARTRFRYRTNTLGGSSGSPCFAMDWTPVALHHMGHSGGGGLTSPAGTTLANQGVPIGLIRAAISTAGYSAYLGPAP